MVRVIAIGALVLVATAVSPGGSLADEREVLLGLRLPPEYEQTRDQRPHWPDPDPRATFPEIYDWWEIRPLLTILKIETVYNQWR